MPSARILPVGPLELLDDRVEVGRHRLAFLRFRLDGRLGRVRRLRPLDLEIEVEFRGPAFGDVGRLDLDQARVGEVGRGLDVAHQGGDTRVRLRVAHQGHVHPALHDRLEIDALRHLAHQLVEEVDRLRAVGLQRLDDLLAREQRLDLVLQLLDLGDLLVELGDLGFEEAVALDLGVDFRGVIAVHGDHDQGAEKRRAAGHHEEVLPRALTPVLAVRQEVDTGHHWGSNLRMAKPQATISEGASIIRRFSCTRGEVCMEAKGLATLVATWVRALTMASSPGITAEPPASRMWSMLWYCVEVKKNCRARCTSIDRFSMNGLSTSASKSSGSPPERLAFSASSALIP